MTIEGAYMDLIEEYLNNIASMKLLSEDYADRKTVQKHNRLAARNRRIAAIIEQKHPELKDRFLHLIEAEDEDVRGWAAHHVLEVMSYVSSDRKKALRAIEDIAENSPDIVQRTGNKMWLKQYYEQHLVRTNTGRDDAVSQQEAEV